MSVTSLSQHLRDREPGRGRDHIVRRVCIHRELDNVADEAPDFLKVALRAMAQHVSEIQPVDDVLLERATLLALAGYAQARVEQIDAEAAR